MAIDAIIEDFFEGLWRGYTAITPQATRIHQLLQRSNQTIINDHVAFRTFNRPPLDIASLEPLLLGLGYQPLEPYQFNAKHLNAWAYLPPDKNLPRIFLSELLIDALSAKAQAVIESLYQQLTLKAPDTLSIFWAGRLWPTPSWEQYQILAAESEYAAWLSVMGLRANHFTVSVTHLDPPDIHAVAALLQREGFTLNSSGGIVKGSPGDLLEQISTQADEMLFEFTGGDSHLIKTCYYEFAKRYPDASGQLYQGFIAANADKIFSSTDNKDQPYA